MTSQEPSVNLYTTQTPNGIKISITLEELGVPYKTHKIDISKNTQKEPWFLAINPNGRIPALTDTFTDGQTINLFESGSIMQYLVDRYDTEYKISYPKGTREWYEMNNWLFYQNAGVGPMQGQANHFTRYAPEHIEYGVNRYQNETRRLYSVLEKHLASDSRPYLTGQKCTIADIAHYGWVAAAGWAGVEIDDYPALKAWEERMTERPGVEKGRHVPDPHTIKELLKDKAKMELKAAEAREWVQAGMKQDAEKSGKL
ncbi:glutathione S-transferase [Dothidotthia symphoricarpi CBS 119687]|uniref:Glutathione S-transferase n=1 Tax=Dothidotthia symphoricarpi CBS 119687 TaxID=1392245 RepID=A0A6A6A3Z1_9PLEO|nr:glutathione S-transferase [Dothidotthia symphoricarpi CBS 119687]KAF2125834.1 glutathione S-transferase [Dothidotthia symphoricarpi CBS 119687]